MSAYDALVYIDKTLDNIADDRPDVRWKNSEVVEMLEEARSLMLTDKPLPGLFTPAPDREIGCGGVLEVPDEIQDALFARVTPEMQAKQDAARERIRERNARLLGTDRENGRELVQLDQDESGNPIWGYVEVTDRENGRELVQLDQDESGNPIWGYVEVTDREVGSSDARG